MARDPGSVDGKYGTASEIGNLDGWTLQEADSHLKSLSEFVRLAITAGEYREYRFKDGSSVHIRPSGQIIRTPHRMYDAKGKRIGGFRINLFKGTIIRPDVWHELPREEQEWVSL
jgi:hypothetical protein